MTRRPVALLLFIILAGTTFVSLSHYADAQAAQCPFDADAKKACYYFRNTQQCCSCPEICTTVQLVTSGHSNSDNNNNDGPAVPTLTSIDNFCQYQQPYFSNDQKCPASIPPFSETALDIRSIEKESLTAGFALAWIVLMCVIALYCKALYLGMKFKAVANDLKTKVTQFIENVKIGASTLSMLYLTSKSYLAMYSIVTLLAEVNNSLGAKWELSGITCNKLFASVSNNFFKHHDSYIAGPWFRMDFGEAAAEVLLSSTQPCDSIVTGAKLSPGPKDFLPLCDYNGVQCCGILSTHSKSFLGVFLTTLIVEVILAVVQTCAFFPGYIGRKSANPVERRKGRIYTAFANEGMGALMTMMFLAASPEAFSNAMNAGDLPYYILFPLLLLDLLPCLILPIVSLQHCSNIFLHLRLLTLAFFKGLKFLFAVYVFLKALKKKRGNPSGTNSGNEEGSQQKEMSDFTEKLLAPEVIPVQSENSFAPAEVIECLQKCAKFSHRRAGRICLMQILLFFITGMCLLLGPSIYKTAGIRWAAGMFFGMVVVPYVLCFFCSKYRDIFDIDLGSDGYIMLRISSAAFPFYQTFVRAPLASVSLKKFGSEYGASHIVTITVVKPCTQRHTVEIKCSSAEQASLELWRYQTIVNFATSQPLPPMPQQAPATQASPPPPPGATAFATTERGYAAPTIPARMALEQPTNSQVLRMPIQQRLDRLDAAREKGEVSAAEYEMHKTKILGSSTGENRAQLQATDGEQQPSPSTIFRMPTQDRLDRLEAAKARGEVTAADYEMHKAKILSDAQKASTAGTTSTECEEPTNTAGEHQPTESQVFRMPIQQRLERLDAAREKGEVSAAEYEMHKAKILASTTQQDD